MTILKFKTNINCANCVNAISKLFNAEKGIQFWSVDIDSPEKFLTIKTDSLEKADVLLLLKKCGFKGEPLD